MHVTQRREEKGDRDSGGRSRDFEDDAEVRGEKGDEHCAEDEGGRYDEVASWVEGFGGPVVVCYYFAAA